MAKLFSLASWNVEHFRGRPERVGRVVAFLEAQRADVFALSEVEGKTVFASLVERFPGYQFHITEGRQVQEILVGVRRGLTAFFTQRVEFKSGNQLLRPGALVTLHLDGANHSILFLHTKSTDAPLGLGLRDDMFRRAFRLKRVLDRAAGGRNRASFLMLGDLNTMGMDYPYDRDVAPALEIRRLDGRARRSGMRLLPKNRPHTWWNGPASRYPPADLDHVLASRQLAFRRFAGAEVDVRGWPQLGSDAEKARWIGAHSDHALLYLEVQKP